MKQRRVILIGFLLVWVLVSPVAARQVEAVGQDAQATSALVEIDQRYAAYGFIFEQYDNDDRYGRFTAHELDVLGSVIVAFATQVGGAQRLSRLVNGPVRVRRDMHEVVSYTQAGQVIGLGQGAFDQALTEENNFYIWGANSGDELAQIVFGHEIGHHWIDTLRKQSGKDWGEIYGQNVWRGERASSSEIWTESGCSPEEEAVTNLALFALGRSYRWTFLHDAPATAHR